METLVCLPGYQITEAIYIGTRTLIYRGVREADLAPVTVKLLRDLLPSFDRVMQFRHQYDIGKNLDLPNVITTLAFEPYQNSYALILEDCGSVSLQAYLDRSGCLGKTTQKLTIFLQIVIQIAEALDGLYHHRIVHKDIKPANILIQPETQQIKLIDFSIASRLPKETQEIKNVNILAGTLAYMSPEQTGRMNRGIDYRSDFYALGVTCYELLTGQLPFISSDPMELVHSHLAKPPVPVRHLQPQIPLMISEIVSKLMSKNAEDRYQNALGLKHDLEICLTQLQATDKIGLFTLGERDPSDRFTIPEKLYGREPEVAILLNAFERVSKGLTEILLMAGSSGVGKTAIVQEVHKPIVRQRGYFIRGKYDQFQRNIPFSAFVQAYRDLMAQLLAESDEQLDSWKTQILAVVGDCGQVLVDVIPELEFIIGKQLPATELAGNALQQRFNLLMQKFVRLFATGAHPLVLFLDDLQWADLASLNLLQLLVQDTGYLLVLGAYRDNEVSPIHPAILAIDEIAKTGVKVDVIAIQPLSKTSLNQLVADTLNCDLLIAQPLTELVWIRTQGNPFFATQFLKALYEDGLICFDRLSADGTVGGWSCDLAKIRAFATTTDVVEFMAMQLQKLPIATQEAISLAACIGAQFDLQSLSIILEKSLAETAAILWVGLEERLLIPTTDVYKFFTQADSRSVSNVVANPAYRFLHDRVQQAAYSLIPDSQKPATHLKLGRLLLENFSEVALEEKLFDIIGHLNLAKELILDPIDLQKIIDLNFYAGKKARNSTAYAASSIYLQIGIEFLNENCWKTQYQLTLDLHVAATESAYLEGNLERMSSLADLVLQSAQTILDTVSIYRIQIASLAATGRSPEAISTGVIALAQLGFELHIVPDPIYTNQAIDLLQLQLQDRQIEDLLDLPLMSDLQAQSIMVLLCDLSTPIFTVRPELMPIISAKMVSLSIQFGNIPASAVGYVNYGFVRCAFFGDIETGYQFGKLAVALVDTLNAKEFKGRVAFLFATWIQHRQEPIRATIPIMKEAYKDSVAAGDLLAIGYSSSCYFDANLLCSIELKTWEAEIITYTIALEQINHYSARHYLEMKRQVALNLMQSRSQPDCLIGIAYDEAVMITKYMDDGELIAIAYVYVYKLMLAYLFGNYPAALENISQGEPYLPALSGMISVPLFHFYAALTHLVLFTEQSVLAQAQTLVCVENHQATIDLWAQNAPMNYLHKVDLIEAEKQRVLGNKAAAIEHYDLAIAGAKEHQFIHEEALANELAAKFYLDWGKEVIAKSYAIEAYYGYMRWGATAKVQQLKTLYPQLLADIQEQATATRDLDITDITNSVMYDATFLDLESLLKASRTISQEIDLEQLITNLLEIVIANAGADKCVLLLKVEDSLQVFASVELGQRPQLLIPVAYELSDDVAISLVNQVAHNLQPILLTDNLHSIQFNSDIYLQKHQPKSILCSPILDRNKLVGILCLENQLTTSSFTRDRLETLQILIAQAAISIENAKLYSQLEASVELLEQKVVERTIESTLAKEAAELAERSKTTFFNNMSHELRTPLNAILGMSEGLEEQVYGPLNSRQLRCVQIVAKSGVHLLGLIDDLLDLAKLEAGKLELYCEPADISRLCDDSLSFVSPQASQKGLQLTVNIPTHLPTLVIDERRMRQVLINLLSNAVKFTPAAGHVSIDVTYLAATDAANPARLEIAVSDTGIGIEPQHLDRLFQPFVQIDSAFNRKAQGTGLGLNLVREIVELHGGRVGVTSEINVGSRFAIELPCGDLPFIFPLSK